MRAIKKAKISIALQIYGLTDPDLINLLARKQAEGVDVQIFYDPKASGKLPLHLSAFPVKSTGLMHRKILVIDGFLTLLGTANCTTQSLKMHDNLVMGIWNEEMAHFLQNSNEEKGEFSIDGISLSAFLLPDFTGEALETLCRRIEGATKSIQMAMFTLTNQKIIEKLLAAKKRGVALSIIVDHTTALGASKRYVDQLQEEGVPISISEGSHLLHHKWALIDEKIFALGSANWTKAAFEKNEDCLFILDDLTTKHQKTLRSLCRSVAKAAKKG